MANQSMDITDIKATLGSVRSETDWNKKVKEIREKCGGELPETWREEIVLSGFFKKLKRTWQ